jgi:hypothetical protein
LGLFSLRQVPVQLPVEISAAGLPGFCVEDVAGTVVCAGFDMEAGADEATIFASSWRT